MGHNVPSWGVAVLITLFFAVMAGVSLGWFRRVDWRWLPAAGALTYPLYLLHESIGWEIFHHLQYRVDRWALLGSTVLGMLLLAHLVHRWVERPVSRRLRTALNASFAQMRAGDADAKGHTPPGGGPRTVIGHSGVTLPEQRGPELEGAPAAGAVH